jgi:hypothetical protein
MEFDPDFEAQFEGGEFREDGHPDGQQESDDPDFEFTRGELEGMSHEDLTRLLAQKLVDEFMNTLYLPSAEPPSDQPMASGAELEVIEPEAAQPFLPFMQVFDGTQETLPINEQNAAGTFLGDYIQHHLEDPADVPDALERSIERSAEGGPAEIDTITSECDGRTMRVCVENHESRFAPGHTVQRITVSEVRANGNHRGLVVGDNSTVYHVDGSNGGIARREDIADLSGPPPEEPSERAMPRTGMQDVIRTLDSWIDRENLGLQNQPVSLEELRALFGFLDRIFNR